MCQKEPRKAVSNDADYEYYPMTYIPSTASDMLVLISIS